MNKNNKNSPCSECVVLAMCKGKFLEIETPEDIILFITDCSILKNIMFIDSNTLNQVILVETLNTFGYTVDIKNNSVRFIKLEKII